MVESLAVTIDWWRGPVIRGCYSGRVRGRRWRIPKYRGYIGRKWWMVRVRLYWSEVR